MSMITLMRLAGEYADSIGNICRGTQSDVDATREALRAAIDAALTAAYAEGRADEREAQLTEPEEE